MNWFTRSLVGNSSLDNKTKLVKEWGGCEHVKTSPALTHVVHYENDPWGKEGYCVCEECYNEQLEETTICNDCHTSVAVKNTIEWKWRDFYAPQGDIPLVICHSCEVLDKHSSRVKNEL